MNPIRIIIKDRHFIRSPNYYLSRIRKTPIAAPLHKGAFKTITFYTDFYLLSAYRQSHFQSTPLLYGFSFTKIPRGNAAWDDLLKYGRIKIKRAKANKRRFAILCLLLCKFKRGSDVSECLCGHALARKLCRVFLS